MGKNVDPAETLDFGSSENLGKALRASNNLGRPGATVICVILYDSNRALAKALDSNEKLEKSLRPSGSLYKFLGSSGSMGKV